MTIVKSAGDNFKSQKSGPYRDKSKPVDIRTSNINAAKGNYIRIIFFFTFSSTKEFNEIYRSNSNIFFPAVADAIRTSLGPRGMDKMVSSSYFTINSC